MSKNMTYEEALAKVAELTERENASTTSEAPQNLHEWANRIRAAKVRKAR